MLLSNNFVGTAHALSPTQPTKEVPQPTNAPVLQVPNIKYFVTVSSGEYYKDDSLSKKTLFLVYYIAGIFFLLSIITQNAEYIKQFIQYIYRGSNKFLNSSVHYGKITFNKFTDIVSGGRIS